METAPELEDPWTTWRSVWGGESSVTTCLSESFTVLLLASQFSSLDANVCNVSFCHKAYVQITSYLARQAA